ncbi:hypothetical protein K8I61_12135 [bacterium]|nr:hypothetical protein [bacterium]
MKLPYRFVLQSAVVGRRVLFVVGSLAIGTAAGLAFAELLTRTLELDLLVAEKLMFYQNADLAVHVADPDPDLFYRLKPGSAILEKSRRVTINRFGARSPEYAAEKPGGVFRIVVVGGSNVYGLGLSNEEAWPARLEQALNEMEPGRYEVWNFGTPGYAPEQMAIVGRQALEKYDPDLVLFAPSNFYSRPMLRGSRLAPYLARDPALLPNLLSVIWTFDGNDPRVPSYHVSLASKVALYRLALLAYLYERKEGWLGTIDSHERGLAGFDALIAAARAREVRVAVFVGPGSVVENYHDYAGRGGVPTLVLSAEDRAREYRDIHPPAYVMPWYAENLARFLRDNGLLATAG